MTFDRGRQSKIGFLKITVRKYSREVVGLAGVRKGSQTEIKF